jgi:5-carboxymethyl-2-hydroxymuconate isomerase
MPHLILEYSENVIEDMEFSELFKECHELLVERLPTSLKSCKSRAYQCEDYYVGDGHADNAFVHLSIRIMPGRARELLQSVGETLLALLKKYFSESLKKLKLEMSIETIEGHEPYFKG